MARRRRRLRTIGSVIVNPARLLGNRKRRRSRKPRARKNGRAMRAKFAKGHKPKMKKKDGTLTVAGKSYNRWKAAGGKAPKRRSAKGRRYSARGKLFHGPMPKGWHLKGRKGKTRISRKQATSRYRRTGRTRTLANRRRRNPGFRMLGNPVKLLGNPMGGFMAPVQKFLKRIPVIGKTSAGALGLATASAIPAIAGTELAIRFSPMWASVQLPEALSFAQPAMNVLKGWGYLPFAGSVLGTLIGTFVPGVGRDVGIAMAAAGWGAGWYQMRQAQLAAAVGISTPDGATVDGLGALVMAGTGEYGAVSIDLGAVTMDYGMGPAYSVGPQGYGGLGAVMIGS